MTSDDNNLISQEEMDELMRIHDLIGGGEGKEDKNKTVSLIDEIKNAILDSGKLTLDEWRSLRLRIEEIEKLSSHIDLIIQLREQKERREKILKEGA
jgi:hypothetical protein